jgi:hypothetical protein
MAASSVAPAKSRTKGRPNNGHFYGQKLIVKANEGGNMEAQYLLKRSLPQTLVDALFLVVSCEVPVQFEHRSAGLKLLWATSTIP